MKLVRTATLSAAALIVAFSFTAVQAQGPENGTSPGGPPTAAPDTDKGGPGPGAAPRMGGPEGGPNAMQGGPNEAGPASKGSAEEAGPEAPKGKSTEQAMPSEEKPAEKPKGAEKTEGATETEGKAGTTSEGKTGTQTEGKTGAAPEGQAQTESKGGKSVKLESQQVSKVRTYFSEHKPSVKRVEKTEVSVSVGVAIPAAIVLYDLPPDIIVVSGACPTKYFVWGDDIVLVDSCTREVVQILVGVA
jgi:hypothetical protein